MDVLGGKVAVVMLSAAWCKLYQEDIVRQLKSTLEEWYPLDTLKVVWKTTEARLKQDGYHGSSGDTMHKEEDVDRCVFATKSGV